MDIEQARRQHEDELMSHPNVVGVGIGRRRGKEVIKVFVTRKLPTSDLGPEDVIPERVEGFTVDVEELGHVQAQAPA